LLTQLNEKIKTKAEGGGKKKTERKTEREGMYLRRKFGRGRLDKKF